ncbi:MAG: ABC transporter permease subunit [Synechococcales bacterium]|nr:ABC transporter permease subunit [Synechococcales bacterium]
MKTVLANIVAIYQRELQSYFLTPWAYIVAAIFWIISGLFFWAIFPQMLQASTMAAQMGAEGQPAVDYAYIFLTQFLSSIGGLPLFSILPILSMGLYSEERKRGTLELLATSPITNWAVASGKLLAVVTFFVTLLLPVVLYELFALAKAEPPISLLIFFWGHFGLVLMAAALLSLGMFISSLTDSTIVAAIATYGLIMLISIIGFIADRDTGVVGAILSHLSPLKHFEGFARGRLDTSSLVLFSSYIFLGIFLTAQSIETFRFQRS